jgi:hypothetical protein
MRIFPTGIQLDQALPLEAGSAERAEYNADDQEELALKIAG